MFSGRRRAQPAGGPAIDYLAKEEKVTRHFAAVAQMRTKFPDLDLIKSGGDADVESFALNCPIFRRRKFSARRFRREHWRA